MTVGAPAARRATLDVLLQIAGRALNGLLGVGVTVILVRSLGERAFGSWATILAVATMAAYFGQLGLAQVAVSRALADPARRAEWIGALCGLRTVLAVPVAALTTGVLLLLADDREMRLAGVIVSARGLLGGLTALRTVFQADTRNDLGVAVELFEGVLWAAAVVALATMPRATIVEYGAAFVACSVVAVAWQTHLALRRWPVRFRVSREMWGKLVRDGLPVGLSGVLILAYGRIDQVLVFELAGHRAAGLYGAAYRLFERAEMLPAAVMTTMFPLIAAAYPANVPRVRRLFAAAITYVTMGTLPILAFTIVTADMLVELLFGAEFAESAGAVRVLMAAFVLVGVGYACGYTTTVLHLRGQFARYALVALIFNVAANFVVIPRYGFVGAAWITLATELLVLLLTLRAIIGRIGPSLDVGRLGRVVAASSVLALALVLARSLHAPLVALVVLAAALTPTLMLLVRAITVREARALLSRDPV